MTWRELAGYLRAPWCVVTLSAVITACGANSPRADAPPIRVARADAPPIRVAVDRRTGVEFKLSGPTLRTTRLKVGQRRPRGRLRAVCGSDYTQRPGTQGHSTRRWPATSKRFTFRLEPTIKKRAEWCVLENAAGDDVAAVTF